MPEKAPEINYIIFEEELENTEDNILIMEKCPECGKKTLVVVSHCATCQNCGYSLCSM